jgi:2-iminobutanoate/2-iminopropanoate deaminase
MTHKSVEGGEIVRYLCGELTKPLPIYSHAAVYNGVAHISAVQGFKPGTFAFADSVADEADQMMRNLGEILAGVGSDYRKILKMSLFFTHMERDFLDTNDVVNRYIPEEGPARSSIGVASLPRGARVVVDCVVVADPKAAGGAKSGVKAYDIELINKLTDEEFAQKFARLSTSKKWNAEMMKRRPFQTAAQVLNDAADVWWNHCAKEDWVESFSGRPVIGDLESFVKDKWCYLEDEHVIEAGPEVAEELERCNAPYIEKFGFIWILLCEGMTPAQQLANYKRRIENDPQTELVENCVEEFKIIRRRLQLCLLDQDPYDAK